MVRKRALERWGTKLANCEVTPQAMWPIAKSHTKRGESKAPTEIRCPLGPIFYPIDKASIIADCLENQLRVHDLCYFDKRRHVDAEIKAPLATVDEDTSFNFRPHDISKEMQCLKLENVCGFDGNEN
jgi:hypothetical protein